MTPTRAPLTIDMISDVVCPWCYVGFRGLQWVSLALKFEYALDIRYRPYRLDPSTPPEGRDRRTTLARKFPDEAHRTAMRSALGEAMADVGLSFDPERPERLPDPTDAHRVVRWAAEEEKAAAAMEALFAAYWHHGEDISRPDVLAQAAAEAGLDQDVIKDRLNTNDDRAAVRQEAEEYRGGGVTGVPTFIVNEATGFSGAHPKATMLDAFRNMAAETAAPGADED